MSVYETATTDLARALGVAEAQRRRGGGVGLCVRVVSAAVLIVIAVSATLLSWGPLRNVFADYQDSPLWVYLLFGLSWLAIACIAAAGAVFLLRRR